MPIVYFGQIEEYVNHIGAGATVFVSRTFTSSQMMVGRVLVMADCVTPYAIWRYVALYTRFTEESNGQPSAKIAAVSDLALSLLKTAFPANVKVLDGVVDPGNNPKLDVMITGDLMTRQQPAEQ